MPRLQRRRGVDLRGAVSNQSGSVLILAAMSITLLLTLAAFSFSVSAAYDTRNKLSAMADAAAKAAAVSLLQQGTTISQARLQLFAQKALDDSKTQAMDPVVLDPIQSCGDVTVGCRFPYNSAWYVKATVSEQVNTFLPGFLPALFLTPRASAVAGVANGVDCLVVMHDLGLASGSSVNADRCNIEIGNTATLIGASSLTADDVIGVGASYSGGSYTPGVVEIPIFSDPLVKVFTPPAFSAAPCQPVTLPIAGATTLPAGHYCVPLTFQGTSSVTLSGGDGNYFFDYELAEVSPGVNVTISAPDPVFIYFNSGSFRFSASSTLNMSIGAKTDLGGIVLYQPATNATAVQLAGNGTLSLNGAIYTIRSLVTATNIQPSSNCALVVAYDFAGSGAVRLDDTCTAFGGSPIKTIATAE